MAINLSRNSKVFFTTNITSAGTVYPTGLTPNNTFEIQVLDGFTFSQNTNAETVTVSESGATPSRGQRSFNTSLAPVDFSFSTYIRPNTISGLVTAEESELWNALLNSKAITNTPTPVVLGTGAINGVAGTGSITGGSITYANGTITIAGTNMPVGGFTAGDTVVLTGLTTTSGLNASYLNTLATVSGTPTANSYVFNLVNNPGATATVVPSTVVSVTKVNSNATTALNTALVAGTGGTGALSSAVYNYSSTTGIGTLTITGTSLPTVTASTSTFYTLTGINVVPNSSTPASATSAVFPGLNSAVYVEQAADSTITTLKLTFVAPLTSHTVLTWTGAPATTIRLLNASWGENAANAYVSTASSDQNQLQKFGMIFLVDNVLYSVDNCALSQVTVDYGIDQITTAQWTGQGTALTRLSDGTTTATSTNILTDMAAGYFLKTTGQVAEITGAFAPKVTTAKYITNKLTTAKLTSLASIKNAAGVEQITTAQDFNIAITGGSFTINNNITYLTPNILSSVNIPAAYFVGTRAITGNITAYLKTGALGDTGDLLNGILAGSSVSTEPMFAYVAKIGGATAPYLEVTLPTIFLQVPTVDIQQVVSTTINFTAEGSSVVGGVTTFNVQKANDAVIRYYN